MSVKVDLAKLAETMADYGFAYLLTVSEDQRPHAVAVQPLMSGDRLIAKGLGDRTLANLAARPEVTLLFPPPEPDGYSLIVDARASGDGRAASLAPARAVLHRPADHPGPTADGSCGNDCVPLSAS